MEGYKIEELYYLYRQGCPIAKRLLVEHCYWQVKMMLPSYCYTSLRNQEVNKDYVQMVVVRCVQALESYRPDRGMQVKSYLSMIIQNSISSLVVRERAKLLKEQHILYSLDDYTSDDGQLRYLDFFKDEVTPESLMVAKDQQDEVDAFIVKKCSELEQDIIDYHKMGLNNNDIAIKLDKDVRCIYNANYRIQKKMEKSNLFD